MSPLPLSREHIEAIQARAEKATPGEWGFAAQNGMRGHCDMAQVYNSTGHALADIEPTPDEAEATATANFIAHARTDILALCKQALWAVGLKADRDSWRRVAERLQTELTAARNALEEEREGCAKVCDRLAQNIADERYRSASVEAIARAREGAVCAAAERIRARPVKR